MTVAWFNQLPKDLVYHTAAQFGLDPLLVAAIVQQESGGNPWMTRYESTTDHYVVNLGMYRDYASKLGISQQTEYEAEKHSWGLMQVMGFVARELGYDGLLTRILIPSIGINLGCLKLQQLFQKYGDVEKVISSYNQGSPRRTAGGMFFNQKSYVDPVFALYRELERARDEKTLES